MELESQLLTNKFFIGYDNNTNVKKKANIMHDGQSDEYVSFHQFIIKCIKQRSWRKLLEMWFFKNKNHQHKCVCNNQNISLIIVWNFYVFDISIARTMYSYLKKIYLSLDFGKTKRLSIHTITHRIYDIHSLLWITGR